MNRAAEHNTRAANGLVDSLGSLGVRHAIVSPGSRNTPLVLALASAVGIEVDVIVDERAAGFVALGQACATGVPSVLVCTSGSAGAHYLPAVLEAQNSRIPLIVITADRPPEMHHCGANQTTVQSDFFGGHVRWFANLGAPTATMSDRWLSHIAARAYGSSLSPGGPVHLNAPFREPLWDGNEQSKRQQASEPTLLRGRKTVASLATEELATRLSGVNTGLILAGPGRSDEPERQATIALAEKLGWPILADSLSGLRGYAEAHDIVVTFYDLFLEAPEMVPRPEAIIRFGRPLTSKVAQQWLASLSVETVVVVDEDGLWEEPSLEPSHFVQASPYSLFEQLREQLDESHNSELEDWMALEFCTRRVAHDHVSTDDWEGAVARRLCETLPTGSLLFAGNSMPIRDIDSFSGRTLKGVTIISNRGVSGIDGAVSALLGAASVWESGPVVGCIGDLTFLHDLDGLAAAAGLDARAALVVINNGGGGIFSFLPIARHSGAFETFYQTEPTHDLGKLCEAVGVNHERIEHTADLGPTLRALLEGPGLSVLEVVIDRNQNIQRHRAVRQAVRSAISTGAESHVS